MTRNGSIILPWQDIPRTIYFYVPDDIIGVAFLCSGQDSLTTLVWLLSTELSAQKDQDVRLVGDTPSVDYS